MGRRHPLGHERNLRDNGSGKKNSSVDSSEKPVLHIFDSLYTAGDAVEDVGTDDFICHYDTMPVDSHYLMEDYFETQLVDPVGESQMVEPEGETQLVDPAGETQLVDFSGDTPLIDLLEETQLVDFAGETQVVDELDCVKNMPIELLNDIDSTNEMEHMCEKQVLSQDDTDKIDGCGALKLGDTAHSHPPKQDSVPKGFMSIRAASVRASGLAARARGAKGSMWTIGDDETSLERISYERDISPIVGSLLESGHIPKNNENNVEQNNLNKCKVGGGTAMRKLFREDDTTEFGQSEVDVNCRDDNPDIPEMPTENCLAGLSYADSQEPGELSQAHALEVVDRFLDLNAMELEESFGRRVRTAEKSNIVSGANGSLNLAKSTILKSTEEGHGTYDWDNTREDDGGGDFFRKTKELFFKKGGAEPRKARPHDTGSVDPLGNFGDKKEQHAADKIGSTDKMLHKLWASGKSPNSGVNLLHRNVVKNLDEQLIRVSRPELAENHICKDVTDMDNIGPDTQMAAEAMENLCFELQLDDNNNNNASNKGTSYPVKGSTRKRNREPPLDEQPTAIAPYLTRAGVARQAKQKKTANIEPSNEPSLSPKQSKKRKKHSSVLGEAEQRKLIKTDSTGQQSATKSLSKNLSTSSVAAANRTGKSTESNHPTESTDSFHHEKGTNDLISVHVLRKKRTPTKPRNAKIVTIEQLKKLGLSAITRPSKTCVGTSAAINIDAVARGQGKRSRQDEVDKYSGKFEIPRAGQKSDAEKPAEGANTNGRLEASPSEKCGTSAPACRTPVTCGTPVNKLSPVNKPSPICMGDEYHKQSCRKSTSKLSLIKEISNLATTSPGMCGGSKELRKRKDITQIKVLFSQHLDEDVVKQQKKILSRLGGAVAPTMSEATHFVADEFVRTRNMLEAISCGKPVVTHLWLESCGQAHCLIDEKNYILRDAKKEKELGFCLPVTLARACQHPLLQGQKVYITPNTKPGKDILANLVKAVHGLPIERLGRSVLKDEKLPEDLLILSCEEDYDNCVPFLEKGGVVYSSELLLNGIVKQKLEHQRHQLFSDHVKRTRSTIWVKQKNQYLPVTKSK